MNDPAIWGLKELAQNIEKVTKIKLTVRAREKKWSWREKFETGFDTGIRKPLPKWSTNNQQQAEMRK